MSYRNILLLVFAVFSVRAALRDYPYDDPLVYEKVSGWRSLKPRSKVPAKTLCRPKEGDETISMGNCTVRVGSHIIKARQYILLLQKEFSSLQQELSERIDEQLVKNAIAYLKCTGLSSDNELIKWATELLETRADAVLCGFLSY